MTHRVKLTWKTAVALAGFLLIAVMFVMPRSVRAEDANSGEYQTEGGSGSWTYDDATNSLTITGTGKLPDLRLKWGGEASRYEKVKTIIIGEGITSIDHYCFMNCVALESITIPSTVETIGDYVFYNCSSLESITLPNDLKTLGACAFEDCNSLLSITFPSNMVAVGSNSFKKCSSLISIRVESSNTKFHDGVFTNIGSPVDLYYNGSKTSAINQGLNNLVNLSTTNATFAKYIAIFDSENKIGTVPEAQEIGPGELFTQPEDMSCDGYKFLGWYEGDAYNAYDTKFDFSQSPAGDVYIWAKWTEVDSVVGVSLVLEEDIGVKVYIANSTETLDDQDSSVTLTCNIGVSGKTNPTKTIDIHSISEKVEYEGKTCRVFQLNVPAVAMTCPISVVVNANGKTTVISPSDGYTVKQYGKVVLENPDQSDYHDLVKAMLNYGAYSQKHFSIKTSDLANDIDGIASFDNVPGTIVPEMTIEVNPTTTSGIPEDWPVEYYGSGLDLKDKVTAYVYFKVPEDFNMDVYFLKINGKTGDFVKRNNDYFICFTKEFTASELSYMGGSGSCPCTITIEENGGSGAHYAYYPALYCSAICNSDKEEITDSLRNLSKALYLYAVACGS